jgi:hypothetical protein
MLFIFSWGYLLNRQRVFIGEIRKPIGQAALTALLYAPSVTAALIISLTQRDAMGLWAIIGGFCIVGAGPFWWIFGLTGLLINKYGIKLNESRSI